MKNKCSKKFTWKFVGQKHLIACDHKAVNNPHYVKFFQIVAAVDFACKDNFLCSSETAKLLFR